ncbi:MAG: hypothetical protein NZ928_03550 [Endomicrobia bacterium]|nr:hypothetical protein [Endomicrobiia bacterium]MDW8055337.1 hypothetical protein [Elusimicrobiota bacterium]
MQHRLKLSQKQKFEIWLDLCDFSYKVMRQNLSKKELEKKLKLIRKKHIEKDLEMLNKIFKYDKKIF